MLEARSPFHKGLSSQREDMGELSKETLNVDEITSIHDGGEKATSNNVFTSGAEIVPHGGIDGEISPMRGSLVSLQEVPKDLICGDQGTIDEHYVPSLIDCETLHMKGEGREDGQHHMIRSKHPYLFHNVDAQKRQTDLCSESK